MVNKFKRIYKYMPNKFAFTLAEILITLAIIGVVAALTIPTIIQSANERATVSALKKAYQTISSAYKLAIQENGTPENWNLIASSDAQGLINFMNILVPYLSVQKKCIGLAATAYKGCMSDTTYKYVGGDPWANLNSAASMSAKVILSDGSILTGGVYDKDCLTSVGSLNMLKNVCVSLTVDLNGFKGPNQLGYDTFIFWGTKTGIVPRGSQTESVFPFSTSCKNKLTTPSTDGRGCAAWVLYNENLDYLHCSNLVWGSKNQCD